MKGVLLPVLCLGLLGCGPSGHYEPPKVTDPHPTASGAWVATNVGIRGVVTLRHVKTGLCYLVYDGGNGAAMVQTAPEVCQP